MKQENSKGFYLISTLCAASILLICIALLAFRLELHQKVQIGSVHSIKAGQRNELALVERLKQGAPFTSNTCDLITAAAGKHLRETSLCLVARPPNDFPLINPVLIATEKFFCRAESRAYSLRTESGFLLTNSALQSQTTCSQLPQQITSDTWLPHNLLSTEAISISAKLLVSGYVDIFTSLTTASSVTLVAGGDIYINEIIGESSAEITLVSASGVVQVSSITGSPNVIAYGRAGTFVPVANNLVALPELPSLSFLALALESTS